MINKAYYSILIFIFGIGLSGKSQINVFEIGDTSYTTTEIFNFFTSEKSSLVNSFGKVVLMPNDSVLLFGKNMYQVSVSDSLNIFFKNRLLFSYSLEDGYVDGVGTCFYPFMGLVAIQAQFRKSRLHGLVYVFKTDGSMLEVMKYRNGKYIRHEFFWDDYTFDELKNRSKMNKGINPLKGGGVITR